MLYSISQEVQTALRAKNVPFPVIYGPEPTNDVSVTRERIVFEYAVGQKSDRVTPPKAAHVNPEVPYNRELVARFRVFARSPKAGAGLHDHQDRAALAVDKTCAALRRVTVTRKNVLSFGAGGFVPLLDEKGTDVHSAAAYEQDFTIDRGVFDTTWAGAGAEEAIIGPPTEEYPNGVAIVTTTTVNTATGDSDDDETV